jgi:hypothetical protein
MIGHPFSYFRLTLLVALTEHGRQLIQRSAEALQSALSVTG